MECGAIWFLLVCRHVPHELYSIPRSNKTKDQPSYRGSVDSWRRTKSVVGTKDRSSVATERRTVKYKYRLQHVYHTDVTSHKNELSVKMTTRAFGVKHEQLQHGEQPYTAAGCGTSFCHNSVLKGHVLYTLDIVGNPVICEICNQLRLENLQYRMACYCF